MPAPAYNYLDVVGYYTPLGYLYCPDCATLLEVDLDDERTQKICHMDSPEPGARCDECGSVIPSIYR